MVTPVAGFAEFELDLELAFKRDLPPFLKDIRAIPLTRESIRNIPANKNGVYLLLEEDAVKYVGKTDAEAGFQQRLGRHSFSIQHRSNLDPSKINFKAAAIAVFKNADLEGMLIKEFNAEWNNSGFGSNDPGRKRDTQEPSDFDVKYPINVDIPIDFISSGREACSTLLDKLRKGLPYTFRVGIGKRKKDMQTNIDIPDRNLTMRDLMQIVVNSLPRRGRWQATILHGRVILYPGHKKYEHCQAIIRAL